MNTPFLGNMPVVDAHHHFWDIKKNYIPWLCDDPMIPFRYGDYTSIRRNYMPGDYFTDSAGINIQRSVYVETEWDPLDPVGETEWIHSVADANGFPHAVVAQAWLNRDDAESVISRQAEFSLVRSVRHKPAATLRVDAKRGMRGSMDDENWRRGYEQLGKHGLRFDLQTPWWHFDQACDLVRDFPQTLLIVNHAGMPADRDEDGLSGWHTALSRLAEFDNVVIKLSGICQSGSDWDTRSNGWIIREALSMFGHDRAMFASNFPVDGVCNSFRSIYDGFASIVENLSHADKCRLFHDNAMRVYAIE